MKEIKFRTWDTYRRLMTTPAIIIGGKEYNVWSENISKPDDTIYMQYTGLKDKNGKDIYEGDILNYVDGDYGSEQAYSVTFKYGMFYLGNDSLWHYTSSGKYKIIGNIHENPELLKK